MIKSSEFYLLSNGQLSGKPTGSDGPAEISTVNPETEEVNRLTFEGVESGRPPGSPGWSPDGSKIIFSTYREGNWEVYMMNADGCDQKNLTNSPNTINGSPSWTPDGKILYSSGETGRYNTFLLNPENGEVTQITDTSLHNIDAE